MGVYYNTIGIYSDGETENLYGSFDRDDCVSELECEKESWKEDGFKKFKIVAIKTTEKPNTSVYGRKFVTEYNNNNLI